MNKLDLLQALSARIKVPSQNLDDLTQIFGEYKAMVAELSAAGQAYKAALQHVPEEYPDLERLIGRKHDAILKGRLMDAIRALKQKIEAIEAVEAGPQMSAESPAPERPVRNTPNLGME